MSEEQQQQEEDEEVDLPTVDDDLGESREGSRTDAEAVERCVPPPPHPTLFFTPFSISSLTVHLPCLWHKLFVLLL